jgi:hypothetical protein
MATTARSLPATVAGVAALATATTFPGPGVAASLQRAVVAAARLRGPVASASVRPYPKIASGRNAETIQLGASTISLIRRSAATLATT